MWWLRGQVILFRFLSWQAKCVRAIKLLLLASSIGSGIHTVFSALHGWLTPGPAVHDYGGTIRSAILTSLSVTAYWLLKHIDHQSEMYGKLDSTDALEFMELRAAFDSLNKDAEKTGCRIDTFNDTAGWTNPMLNKALLLASGRQELAVSFVRNESPWLAYDVKDLGHKSTTAKLRTYVIEGAMRRQRMIFNADKVRLAADIDSSLRLPVQLQRTDYVSSMMTGGLAFQRIYMRGADTPIRDGMSTFLERSKNQWRLKPLAGCESSNQLGVSTLAFSSDGFLVFVDQTALNQHSALMISPSGSGSLDWSDIPHENGSDFLNMLKAAAIREVLEETGLDTLSTIDRDDLVRKNTIIIGFTRLIHRGGKPEFFCLARLPEPIDKIKGLSPKSVERKYSARSILHDASPLNTRADFVDELRRICNYYWLTDRDIPAPEGTRKARMSYQVRQGLRLLEDCLANPEMVTALRVLLLGTDAMPSTNGTASGSTSVEGI